MYAPMDSKMKFGQPAMSENYMYAPMIIDNLVVHLDNLRLSKKEGVPPPFGHFRKKVFLNVLDNSKMSIFKRLSKMKFGQPAMSENYMYAPMR